MAVSFAPGDRVHLAGIGTGVVRDLRHGNLCAVQIKDRVLIVAAGRLTRAEQPRPPRRAAPAAAALPDSGAESAPARRPPPELDLHGKTVVEAVEALDDFLNRALLAGHPIVHVIHGRTGGRVKGAVHARLAALTSVQRFHVDPRNPGLTVVTL